jgi:hypothetical protein
MTSPGKPDVLAGNPGQAASGEFSFTDGVETWSESIHLAQMLKDAGFVFDEDLETDGAWLIHGPSGLLLLPLLTEYYPIENGGYQSLTTIQVHHSKLMPDGVFEYQHSTGESLTDSIRNGFQIWLQTDFVALVEATRTKIERCTSLEMVFPAIDNQPKRVRRAVLGPVAHYCQSPLPDNPDDEHPFCPCCLLTRSFQAFEHLLKDEATYCIRFFAARDQDGQTHADCRVNGEDFEPGAKALREYATTWAEAGYEFRKQYVVLQSLDGASVDDEAR